MGSSRILDEARAGGQVGGENRTIWTGLSGRKPMRKHRSYPIEFKRQVAQEYLAGETLQGLAKRHEVSRNL